jgi:hypothetical protein
LSGEIEPDPRDVADIVADAPNSSNYHVHGPVGPMGFWKLLEDSVPNYIRARNEGRMFDQDDLDDLGNQLPHVDRT